MKVKKYILTSVYITIKMEYLKSVYISYILKEDLLFPNIP